MAKSISPELLEQILTRVTDKFNDMFKLFVEQVVSAINNRIDNVEAKFGELSAQMTKMSKNMDDLGRSATKLPAEPAPVKNDLDTTVKALMAVELEKDDRAKRSRNIIITGLVPEEGRNDTDVFNTFCEHNLTVKPHLLSCSRVGKATATRPAKLRITLDNSQAAEDLLASSSILRQSSDTIARSVYFNRDLTRMEAQTAYEERQRRRSINIIVGSGNPGSSTTI